jgi:hypothetical protein
MARRCTRLATSSFGKATNSIFSTPVPPAPLCPRTQRAFPRLETVSSTFARTGPPSALSLPRHQLRRTRSGQEFSYPRCRELRGRRPSDGDSPSSRPFGMFAPPARSRPILLLPGSSDLAYSPSKVYPYYLSRRPTLGLVFKNSVMERLLDELACAYMVRFTPRRTSSPPTNALVPLLRSGLRRISRPALFPCATTPTLTPASSPRRSLAISARLFDSSDCVPPCPPVPRNRIPSLPSPVPPSPAPTPSTPKAPTSSAVVRFGLCRARLL